jgi:hypothetical protein
MRKENISFQICYSAGMDRRGFDDPISSLAVAMLMRAVQDALGIIEACDCIHNREKRIQRDAINWICENPNYDWQVNYDMCCQAAGIDKILLRKFALNPENKTKLYNLNFKGRLC